MCSRGERIVVSTVALVALCSVGCALAHERAPDGGSERIDGAIGRDDGSAGAGSPWWDGGASDDGGPPGPRDAGRVGLPTYHPCWTTDECREPLDECSYIRIRDAFGELRADSACSPRCTVDEDCPEVEGKTAICRRGVCLASCDPGAPGTCWSAQVCRPFEDEAPHCLPQ